MLRGLTFDEVEALYWFCCHYHSGQWSRGYRIMCRLTQPGRFKPAPLHDGPTTEEAKMLYKQLVDRYKDKV